jgi:hypothetical protein
VTAAASVQRSSEGSTGPLRDQMRRRAETLDLAATPSASRDPRSNSANLIEFDPAFR